MPVLKCGHPDACWRDASKTCGWCCAAQRADIAEKEAQLAEAELALVKVRVAELNAELFRKTARCMELAEQNAEQRATIDALRARTAAGDCWLDQCACVYSNAGLAELDCPVCDGMGAVIRRTQKEAT